MLSTGLKQSLTLALVMAALAGCSSTSTTDQDAAADSTMTGTADTTDTSSMDTMEQEPAPVLDTVFYFEFDQSTLNADARAALTAHAANLKAAPQGVRLEGHADERGTREYNMALGERRAKSVRDFLVLQGVDGSLIETVSYGEEYPAVLGSSESSYSQNRRVELK
ncbi:peptidoglycan-associated lipoprotein Pal [Aestuariicella hydrocarbonica]|uniref:Peptidoglycan-associated lipoprotein n=1 Tax=Pseudomaricurvus hydrocarbonicus TaxID=1470433 RepID=A0A9E5JSM1_9GAMM|nr:peptidoglycan-associated lipoprotein Pal [Aestuariicella hydrocarbonica]NHO64135.1 peptidoglycan-associated lipoprotein Pal [Aestuariicella hydrocarbonica]